MSIYIALLFPAVGALALAATAACVALMIHYRYPRQSRPVSADAERLSLWVEANPEPEPASPRREFIQIRRLRS